MLSSERIDPLALLAIPHVVWANPASGRGHAWAFAARWQHALQAIGCSCPFPTPIDVRDPSRHAQVLAEVSEGMAWVAGGDGSLSRLVGAMQAKGWSGRWAPLPAGTANLLAHRLGWGQRPQNMEAWVQRALKHLTTQPSETSWPPLLVNTADQREGTWSCLNASAGWDAAVLHRVHRQRTGPINLGHYVVAGFPTLLRAEPGRYHLQVDGQDAGEFAQLMLTPDTVYGHRRWRWHDADLPWVWRVIALRAQQPWQVLKWLWRGCMGNGVADEAWVRTFKHLQLNVYGNGRVQCDGEPLPATATQWDMTVGSDKLRWLLGPGTC